MKQKQEKMEVKIIRVDARAVHPEQEGIVIIGVFTKTFDYEKMIAPLLEGYQVEREVISTDKFRGYHKCFGIEIYRNYSDVIPYQENKEYRLVCDLNSALSTNVPRGTKTRKNGK